MRCGRGRCSALLCDGGSARPRLGRGTCLCHCSCGPCWLSACWYMGITVTEQAHDFLKHPSSASPSFLSMDAMLILFQNPARCREQDIVSSKSHRVNSSQVDFQAVRMSVLRRKQGAGASRGDIGNESRETRNFMPRTEFYRMEFYINLFKLQKCELMLF